METRHNNRAVMELSMKRYTMLFFLIFNFWFAVVHHHKRNRIRISVLYLHSFLQVLSWFMIYQVSES